MSADILPELEIMERVSKKYGRFPVGWKLYQGISEKGNPEFLIIGKENWHIRRDRYSGRLGIGIRLDDSVEPTVDAKYAGLRPVPNSVMDLVIELISKGADPSEVERVLYRSARRIVRQDPVGYEELERIRPRAILQGPIVSSERPLQEIIAGQAELDAKLDFELAKMQRKSTSGYIG